MLKEKLMSRKFWALLLGIVLLFLTLPPAEAVERSAQLLMVYMGAQGIADFNKPA